ncbi:MAG TPA: hypothetical protein VGO56_05585 [Pyrinomonadaceae bacterium]|jgi:hypothetical protein|nr:hypothetical protein [Pyrinomonadaceae bacterium]
MDHRILTLAILSLCLLSFSFAGAQQIADPKFDTRVDKPAFTKNFPRVLFDEAHNNIETTSGRYKPFADLLFNDGYHIAVNRQPFTKQSLATHKILIIANPLGVEDVDDEGADGPAFTTAEVEAVNDWVRGGGALLLIVDAVPFGSATETLATQLGVEMSKTETIDPANTEKELETPSVIVYSRENHQLAESSITNGRERAERLNRVLVFSGQSLKGPQGSDAFLKLADTAVNEVEAPGKNTSAAGRAQGIAFRAGKGRVVVLGDAAMLSAQLTGVDNQSIGMNVANVDNRTLALNIMHWLSGILK